MFGSRGDALGSDPTPGGAAVTFNEVLSQTIAMLHQHGRVSYRALKRQFALQDDYLEDLKDAIEGVSDLLISCQTATPNSYRLIKSPITKSCMCSVLEKQIVRRTNRLIRVRKLMCLLSIFCVCAFPIVCRSASRCRS